MKRNKSTVMWVAGLVLVVAALLIIPRLGANRSNGITTTVPCLVPNVALVQHIHPHLTIKVDGVEETIPTNIGLGSCERAVHTHDGTGTIHVEAQDNRQYTIGDFFDVWGKPIARDSYQLLVIIDGTADVERPDVYRAIQLKDNQQIVMEYTKTPVGK